MAAARYWRLHGVATWGGDLQLSELQLHDASGRADASASLSCSHAPVNGSLSDLQDGSTAALCRFAAADVRSSGFWLQWDLGPGGDKDIASVRIGSGTSKDAFVESVTVASSATGVVWDTAFTLGGIKYVGPLEMTLAKVASTLGKWLEFGSSASTVDQENLTWTCSGLSGSAARADVSVQSGKWYWEQTVLALDQSGTASTTALNAGVWPVSRAMNTYIYLTTGVRRIYPDVTVGDVMRFAFDADAGTLAIYRNAALLGGVTGEPLSMSEPWAPVIGEDNAGGARVKANFGASPFAFSPPTGYSPIVPPGLGLGPRQIKSNLSAVRVSASASVHVFSVRGSILATACDVQFGGPGTIYGTTKTKGTPNLPTKARVVLQHQRSKLPVRETWSDPITGAFAFTGIDINQQFLTLAEDAAGNFLPVAANKLTPEVIG